MLRSKGNRDQQHAPVFFALGDETRLWLVGRLADGSSHSISELTEGSTLTRQAITKHLHVLEGQGWYAASASAAKAATNSRMSRSRTCKPSWRRCRRAGTCAWHG